MRLPLFVCCLLLAFTPGPATPMQAEVEVDAREFARNLVRVKLLLPVSAGPLTLHYPRWVPGNHAPTGPIDNLTGLTFTAGGTVLDWRRDDADPYSFHLDIPSRATVLEVRFDLLGASSPSSSTFGTPRLGIVNWNQVLLYSDGKDILRQKVKPSLTLPDGWKFASALRSASQEGSRTTFQPVDLEELIDSPLLAGEFFREVQLGKDGHSLVLACDSEEGLRLPAAYQQSLDRLVVEAGALFGSRPYRKYRFLLTLSDRTGPSGLEHHESSDNRLPERALLEEPIRKHTSSLLPHEFVHAWNGKYRRPADMVVTNYQKPHLTRMLWVYEGLTEYLGFVLTARSGLWSAEETRQELAHYAEMMTLRRGRTWRPLEDTAAASHTMRFRVGGWASRQRSVSDYYLEGMLLWLEVDTMLRDHSGGKKSLDDFCKVFFACPDTTPSVKPYTLDELAAELERLAPIGWKKHLERRVALRTESAPLEGITLGGWQVAYGDKPTPMQQAYDTARKAITHASSIGLVLKTDGTISDVIPERPADRAGLAPGMKLLAVDGRRFTPARLAGAIAGTRETGKLELLVENGDFFRVHSLAYREGGKYPRLEARQGKVVDHLSAILAPRVPVKAP